MYKTVTWNTGPAAERARFNLELKNKKKEKSKKPQATSRKRQASSLKEDTIK